MVAGCSRAGPSLDLLEVAPGALQDATVAGQPRDWVLGQTGLRQRLRDVVRATLPAGPPSRLVFRLDVPRGARLSLACGIAPQHHSDPGVEFSVKIRRGGRESVAWTALLNPISEPTHRGWVPAEIDLSPHTGERVEVVLETTGYEETGDPLGAFWATPTLVAPNASVPLVIVYLVDSLRADHTTPYGYRRDTTPRLADFARDAVLFEQAVASSGWTKPSVASLFTSLLPDRHGVMQLPDPLEADVLTLAEMLGARGYATGAVVANATLYSRGSGFDQGFDVFAGVYGAEDRRSKIVDAARVVDASLALIDARRGLPSFLYVHTMDAHVPYVPPEPFDRLYGPAPAPERPASDPRRDYRAPEDLERVIAQYDGCVAYGDQEFGRFVSELRARGLYDRALILFMADHGEEFLDHGRWTHQKSVFDELVRVPLVVKYPKRGGPAGGSPARSSSSTCCRPSSSTRGSPFRPRPPWSACRSVHSRRPVTRAPRRESHFSRTTTGDTWPMARGRRRTSTSDGWDPKTTSSIFFCRRIRASSEAAPTARRTASGFCGRRRSRPWPPTASTSSCASRGRASTR